MILERFPPRAGAAAVASPTTPFASSGLTCLVFTEEGQGVTKIYNSGWKAARRRASERYEREFGTPCAPAFRRVRIHDLKHTYGYLLRAAGVQFEDRQLLLGHKAAHVTTHYSAADISNLIAASERVCDLGSRKSPAIAIVRAQGASQVADSFGGKGGTRTLDPGIMSAVL